MTPYAGAGRGSGIVAYKLGRGFIDVQFEDGTVYRYDDGHPGAAAVEAMGKLAQAGAHLNTYINKHVRDNFAAQLQ
ncbi:MAG: hypothetical protein CL583_07095 [Alteromonadaceae bacterium]|nr:hypothetical protein [Alteromonadaceae bacterium]